MRRFVLASILASTCSVVHAQDGAGREASLAASYSLARAHFKELSGLMLARVSEAETKRLALARRLADFELAKKKAESDKVAVDLAESRVREYADAACRATEQEFDNQILAVEAELRGIEARTKLVRSFNTAPGVNVDTTIMSHKAALALTQARKRLLLEFTKPIRVRELTSEVEDARAEAEAAAALLDVDRVELEARRRDSADAAPTDLERAAMSSLEKLGPEWEKLAAEHTARASLDETALAAHEARLAAVHRSLTEIRTRWDQARLVREIRADAAALAKIREALGTPTAK